MSKQFKEQGGAATMDPSRFRRWVTSKVMTKLISFETLTKRRAREERRRKLSARPHIIEYFHQALYFYIFEKIVTFCAFGHF